MASTTRENFITYVQRELKRPDKVQEVLDALTDTIRDVTNRHSFNVLRRQAYVPVVAGQEDYPLPTDLLHWHKPVRILEGSVSTADGYILDELSKEEYDYWEPNPNRTNPATGRPWGFCFYANELLLTDIPDQTAQDNGWLIEINYGKQPTIPSEDTHDAHPFGSTWDETIKWGILCRIFAGIGLDSEANKWGGYFEAGKPIIVGGKTVGYLGGVANMIELDSHMHAPPQFVEYNPI